MDPKDNFLGCDGVLHRASVEEVVVEEGSCGGRRA